MGTMHSGGERYVIVHAGVVREGEKTRIETFMEGHETHAGERLQWIVEGVKHKSNFLCQMVSEERERRAKIVVKDEAEDDDEGED